MMASRRAGTGWGRIGVAVWLGLAACLGAGSSGCQQAGTGEGPGHRAQALALSPSQELNLGQQAYQEVLKKYPVVPETDDTPDGRNARRVRKVGERIAHAAEIEPLQREINLHVKGYTWDWRFKLLKNNAVNAFCLPGGKVGVFTGLMPVAENDDQLATVMSHEIAHALAHHASERIKRQEKLQTALGVLNGTLGALPEGERRQLIGLLGAGASARSLAYDREQESEADHIGLFLMTFAGYDPDQAVAFWERMRQIASKHGAPPEILSDHPSDAKRIEQIKHWTGSAKAALEAYRQGRIAPAR